MEPIISKLQEGVKYPRFERDATTIINDLVEHITKERGVYSSSIEPNPSEHKIWFNTNNNTLNIYENGRWNTISGQGGGGSSSGAIINNATINTPTISRGTISGAFINDAVINNANINNPTISGVTISGGNINGVTLGGINISSGAIKEGGTLNYGSLVLLTYAGTVTNPVLIPNGGVIGNYSKSVNVAGINISNGAINNGKINGATISGGNISGATINGGYLTGSITASGATINGGNIHGATLGAINVTSGSINYASINNATINDATITGSTTINGATISGATISGGNINVNKIEAKSIETPYIKLTSGSESNSIQLLGDNYVFNGKLADSTLFHSIDLNSGSIAGLTSIKTLSYTGLTIEPYDVTSTGTPITIHGRAAGINIIADSTAHVNLECITKLNWIKGSSVGYMMTFNTTNNTVNSNYDTFNISNGTISGSANVDLSLSGTIKGGTISGATISYGTLSGSIAARGASIRGVTIDGGTISGATINGGFITGSATINGATISGATMSGGNIYGAAIGNVSINAGSAFLYAGSKILVTYTGSVANPILIPNGGSIGYPTAPLTLCGVTLTGGDFTKLKNLQ